MLLQAKLTQRRLNAVFQIFPETSISRSQWVALDEKAVQAAVECLANITFSRTWLSTTETTICNFSHEALIGVSKLNVKEIQQATTVTHAHRKDKIRSLTDAALFQKEGY